MQNNPTLDSALLPGLYRKTILSFPLVTIALLVLVLCFFGWQARNFALDASADALLLEDDKDLQTFRETAKKYSVGDFLVVTYQSKSDLWTTESISQLSELSAELETVESVDTVLSLLDVPLLTSAGVSLTELTRNVPTLATHPESDLSLVEKELTESPVFRDLIISEDGSVTAMMLNLKSDENYSALSEQRSALKLKELSGGLSDEESAQLTTVNTEFDKVRAAYNKQRHDDIASIRTILKNHRSKAQTHLGGVPMVTDDMISYIARDLVVFGIGVVVFILATLTLIFRQMRWVMLPVASCLFAGLSVTGLLGLIGWKVTVISSNFMSLMFILTMSMNIHLVVRFRRLKRENPELGHTDRV